MRILSRRTPTPDQRYVVMPARPQELPSREDDQPQGGWGVRLLRRRPDASAGADVTYDLGPDAGEPARRRPAPQPDPDFWSERQVRGRRRTVLRRRRVLLSLVAVLLVTALAAAVS